MVPGFPQSQSITSIANIGCAVTLATMTTGNATVMAAGMSMATIITGAAATF